MENGENLTRQEFFRKLIHITSLVVPGLYFVVPRWHMVLLISLGLLIAGTVEILRFTSLPFGRLFERLFRSLLRDQESTHLTGATYLILGFLLTTLLFPREEAIFGMFVTGFSDAAAALVGRTLGRHKLPGGKTLEGSLAFFAATFVLAGAMFSMPWGVLVGVAAATTFVELIWRTSTDNLFLPVISALLIWLLQLGPF